jgi:hypothetical protein
LNERQQGEEDMSKQRRMAVVAVLTLGSGAPALGGFTVINGFEN